jgi:hypothetical protein
VAADLLGGVQAGQRAFEGGFGLREIASARRRTHLGFGAFGGLARALYIYVMRHFGRLGHHRDMIFLNFDKSARHGKKLDAVTGAQTNIAGMKFSDERCVVGQNSELAVNRRDDDGIHVRLQDPAFRRQDIDGNRGHF